MIDQSSIDLLALIERSTPLCRVANTGGGEYVGACPFCGGTDRFHVWPNADNPRWWCRRCSQKGDTIAFVMRRHGCNFAEALYTLGLGDGAYKPGERLVKELQPPEPIDPPSDAWQTAAVALVNQTESSLWSAEGTRALAWLRRRGFHDATLRQARLGYNPKDRYVSRSAWGLMPETSANGREKQLWLPRGVVIPWFVAGEVWKLYVRRPISEPKYHQAPGGSNALYNADTLEYDRPAILCEAAFDALAIQQEAGDLVAAVASGTTGARCMRWIAQLAWAAPLLLSFDNDNAGTTSTSYWRDIFPKARMWRAYFDDPAAMLEARMDVRAWVLAGLGKQDQPQAPPKGWDIRSSYGRYIGYHVERQIFTKWCLTPADVVRAVSLGE